MLTLHVQQVMQKLQVLLLLLYLTIYKRKM
jgi:hypothetical protein